MPTEIKLWQIEGDTPKPVSQDKLDLESRLENWIRDDIGLVNDDLLVIGQQVPTEHTGGIDLLAMDSEANLVILELKRDMTSREVVAQALDYASYVQKLGLSDIEEIVSNSDFLNGKGLDQAFRDKFDEDLPDPVNQTHRMYIVASSLDSATERIVEYLSETHGVDINVATFAYFNSNGQEMIGRSMLLDEEIVQKRSTTRRGTKRRPPLTESELRDIAERNGVVALWDKAVEEFRSLSQGRGRSRSSMFFNGKPGQSGERSARSFVSMYPGRSSQENGLAIGLRFNKIEQDFDLAEEDVLSACGLEPDTDNRYFFDADRLHRLIELLKKNAPQD